MCCLEAIDLVANFLAMGRILIFIVTLIFCKQTYALAPLKSCKDTGSNYTIGSVYEKNLNLLLGNLSSKSSSLKFYNYKVGDGSNQVHGLFQCRLDVGLNDCKKCVEDATEKIIKECPSYGEAILWPDDNDSLCMLRYANHNFSTYEKSPVLGILNSNNISNYDEFLPILKSTMKELIQNASLASPHFASATTNWASFQRLYTYAQCTPDIDARECYDCLEIALHRMIDCCSRHYGVKYFLPSCQLRFEFIPFLNETFLNEAKSLAPPTVNTPLHPPPNDKRTSPSSNKAVIMGAIAACVSIGLLVVLFVLWICLCRKKPNKEPSTGVPPASPTALHDDSEGLGGSEFVQYDLVTLNTATRNFSAENKLGEGGFGSVYRGTLENGEKVAIKRLSGTSRQGTKEFLTEARLLARLQHKNLVKLVGYCSEGEEKLLVYEFMSNSSLDRFLFDPRQRPLLYWEIRSKIITGIARGLQYLHEDSRLTIIHRDLKPANVLLDMEINPKIADFGLAKLFEVAQKFGSTSRISGTLGYMAPEYMTTGEYSNKSDVYSFGIMLLEIVSGRNNKKIYEAQLKEDLPVYAWRLWNEGASFDLADPALNNNNLFRNDVVRCIHIGLLCLQANAEKRPTMTLVVSMLTGSVDLPLPSAPAMSFPQFNVPMAFNDWQKIDNVDQDSSKSDIVGVDMTQDSHQIPR